MAFVSEFDDKMFRTALGAFATGVAIATMVTEDGERHGLTISSFNSVSLSPPLVLFSIGRHVRSYELWKNAGRYVVNVLAEHQRDLSSRFGRPAGDKWQDLQAQMSDGGVIFPESLAMFDCEAYARHEAGDHDVLIGRVRAISLGRDGDLSPLLFYAGQYHSIDRDRRAGAGG